MVIINTEHTSGIPEETASEDSQKGVTIKPITWMGQFVGYPSELPPAGYSQTPH